MECLWVPPQAVRNADEGKGQGRVEKLGSFAYECWLKQKEEGCKPVKLLATGLRGEAQNEKEKQLSVDSWRMSGFRGEQMKSPRRRRRRCLYSFPSFTHLVNRYLVGTYHGRSWAPRGWWEINGALPMEAQIMKMLIAKTWKIEYKLLMSQLLLLFCCCFFPNPVSRHN